MYVPPDKNVTGFLASEVIIVLQDYLISVPDYYSKFISGKEEGRKEERGEQRRGRMEVDLGGIRLPIKITCIYF